MGSFPSLFFQCQSTKTQELFLIQIKHFMGERHWVHVSIIYILWSFFFFPPCFLYIACLRRESQLLPFSSSYGVRTVARLWLSSPLDCRWGAQRLWKGFPCTFFKETLHVKAFLCPTKHLFWIAVSWINKVPSVTIFFVWTRHCIVNNYACNKIHWLVFKLN